MLSDVNNNILDERMKVSNYTVGIGASAGGLEALQLLLTNLPPDTGFPFVIVQHLSPDYKSLLGEILSKYTQMPVVQAEEGMEVKPNSVYIIPPGKNMQIVGGKLLLSKPKEHGLNLPIDMFFRSLAEEAGAGAIAIVLSGTGSDGTNGIKAIKENNGMIMVQEPLEAQFDGMPRSAMHTGLVDALLPVDRIAKELQLISSSLHNGHIEKEGTEDVSEDMMKKIYFLLQNASNINFTHYKQNTILRRIERRMILMHKDTLEEYVNLLQEDPEEATILSKEILIGVTRFFREPDFFNTLKEKAIKNIVRNCAVDEDIRIWVAGCSTGEEAYSIAILCCEAMEELNIKHDIKIFATDLDGDAITYASKGVYNEDIADAVTAERLSRYFVRKNSTYTIKYEIRRMIVFSMHNILQDPPFGRLDLISCRNMLIYFQSVLQNGVFAIFNISLKDGGYLFLGKSEAIGTYTEAYPVVDAEAKIFLHKGGVKIADSKTVPLLHTVLEKAVPREREFAGYEKRQGFEDDIQVMETSLLEEFLPACLVFNSKTELIHTYGNYNNYVHFSLGKASVNLYDVLTESLKVPVCSLIKEAQEKQTKVRYSEICFEGERQKEVVNLTVKPVGKKGTATEGYYALVITPKQDTNVEAVDLPYQIDSVAARRIMDLEQEVGDMRGELNKSVAKQECVNEELQAANEELLTSNEELQSSNEELQSVNEELYTVNAEYQSKLTEVANMNNDITNFLATTLIGIIFVDNNLNIRRFTDYVATNFNVMEQDIGRSLQVISYQFHGIDISSICSEVLKTLTPIEREIDMLSGKVFLMRVAPYRTTENKILGGVITLVDITKQKQEQRRLETAEQKLSQVQRASEAKSDFLSRMSHEMRTPMNTIVNVAELMDYQLDDKAALKLSVSHITEAVKYMTSIISDILDMSKIENSQLTLLESPFSLKVLAEDVLSIVRISTDRAEQHLAVAVSEDLAAIYVGDKFRLEQILINFLMNASKFTEKGGTIGFKAFEDASIDGRASICFEISDTGKGISKEFLPELFKPFSRENNQERAESSGMGLGLSIAHSLIKLMHGEVHVQSEVGKGTTFTIHVLLGTGVSHKNDVQESLAIRKVAQKLDGCKVLLAEDNVMNRELLSKLLQRQRMTVVEAVDGEEALKEYLCAPENTIDFILMDMQMPRMNGVEATKAIRTSGRDDALSIPIIGVSASCFVDDIEAAGKAGMSNYVTKPIDIQHLLSVISSLVRR